MALISGLGSGQQLPLNRTAAPKPVKPASAAGAAAGSAAGSLAQKAANAGSSSSPYLDATALANIASYLNKTNTTTADDQATISQDQTALQNTLGQDRQANQLANLKLMTDSNARGGLYGSGYGQQLGNQNTAYGQKEDAAASSTNLNIAKLQNAIASLNASEPIYADQQAADAASRAAASAAKLAPAATTPTTPAAKPASTLAQKVAAAQSKANAKQNRQTGTPMGGFRA